jgi:demethylmenaquinone methyltransferase/2-methoxy-6-polyprenyl-1,4-benzoquinol methylase
MKPGGRLGILEFSEPGNWLLRILYDTYSFTIMPWLGRIISGSEAYQYLPASIRQFWSRQELGERMKQAGLTDVRSIALMGGIACIHLGTKVE